MCLDPGLPPKSPVYAVINKANKKKSLLQQEQSQQPCSMQSSPQRAQLNQHQQMMQQPQPNQIFNINQQSYQQQQHFQQQQLPQQQHQVNQQQYQPQQQVQQQQFQQQQFQLHQAQQQFQQQQYQQQQVQQQQFQQQQLQQQQYQQQQQALQQQNGGPQYHNYCNIAPLLGDVVKQSGSEYHQTCLINPHSDQALDAGSDNLSNGGHYYENSSAVLARLNDTAKTSGMGDYIPMDPKIFQTNCESPEMPLVPFEPFKCNGKSVQPPPKYDVIDPISQKLQEFQDALDTDETTYASLINNSFKPGTVNSMNCDRSSNLFNLCDLGQGLQLDGEVDFQSLMDSTLDSNKSTSMEILTTTGWLNDPSPPPPSELPKCSMAGALTIPRTKHQSDQAVQPVTMRRSSSVPSKPITDRGSTSSSDSGFAPGSPSQNTSTSLSHLIGTKNEK